MQRTEKLSWTGIVFMAIAAFSLAMFMIAAPAQAVVDCSVATSTDTDGDGFTDVEECGGLTLLDGTAVPNCNTGSGSAGCMNPDAADLFVILVPASPSLLPDNPFEYAKLPVAQGGLGMTLHIISQEQAESSRNITSAQKAVRITEDTVNDSGNTLGYANQGTPNGLDNSVIYTQRIINHIDEACAGASECTNLSADGTVIQRPELDNLYIKQTLNHELGHLTDLTVDYTARFGGHHYKTGTGVMMDQSVKYTLKGSKVTFYIPSQYSVESQAGVRLN